MMIGLHSIETVSLLTNETNIFPLPVTQTIIQPGICASVQTFSNSIIVANSAGCVDSSMAWNGEWVPFDLESSNGFTPLMSSNETHVIILTIIADGSLAGNVTLSLFDQNLKLDREWNLGSIETYPQTIALYKDTLIIFSNDECKFFIR